MTDINTHPDFPGDRGFAHFEPTDTSYGTIVSIYESSNADGPSLWLKLEQPEPKTSSPPELEAAEAHAHLFLSEALEIMIKLAAAIRYVRPGADPPQPGRMHPVDKALYELVSKERNLSWHREEKLEKRIAAALAAIDSDGSQEMKLVEVKDILEGK